MASPPPATDRRRLSKDARREQLLDVAADLVVSHGTAGLTMEGLAAAAGVSKALPYRHFSNADAVLGAVYRREVTHFGGRILEAVNAADGAEAMLRAAVGAYFDVVSERGRILTVFAGPGSPIPEVTREGQRASVTFTADLLERAFDVHGRKARVLAGITLGALNSAVDLWAHRTAPRAVLEQLTVTAIMAAAEAVAAAD